MLHKHFLKTLRNLIEPITSKRFFFQAVNVSFCRSSEVNRGQVTKNKWKDTLNIILFFIYLTTMYIKLIQGEGTFITYITYTYKTSRTCKFKKGEPCYCLVSFSLLTPIRPLYIIYKMRKCKFNDHSVFNTVILQSKYVYLDVLGILLCLLLKYAEFNPKHDRVV